MAQPPNSGAVIEADVDVMAGADIQSPPRNVDPAEPLGIEDGKPEAGEALVDGADQAEPTADAAPEAVPDTAQPQVEGD